MITFSRRLDRRPYMRARPIARIEIGIAASMTWPTFSPEYAEAAVKIAHRKRPHQTERAVASGGAEVAGTTGRYVSPGASGRYAFSGRDLVSDASIGPPSQ